MGFGNSDGVTTVWRGDLSHRQIIEAIRSQDANKTAKVLYSHIEDAGRHLVDQLRIEENRNTV